MEFPYISLVSQVMLLLFHDLPNYLSYYCILFSPLQLFIPREALFIIKIDFKNGKEMGKCPIKKNRLCFHKFILSDPHVSHVKPEYKNLKTLKKKEYQLLL